MDLRWWDEYAKEVKKGRWPEFRGERWSISRSAHSRYGVHWIKGEQHPGICPKEGTIHLAGNGGHGAVDLAVKLGGARIVLLGYDMQKTGGKLHWHGSHPAGLGNPSNFTGWCKRFEVMARDLAAAGIQAINASRETALKCFPRASIEDALNGEVCDEERQQVRESVQPVDGRLHEEPGGVQQDRAGCVQVPAGEAGRQGAELR